MGTVSVFFFTMIPTDLHTNLKFQILGLSEKTFYKSDFHAVQENTYFVTFCTQFVKIGPVVKVGQYSKETGLRIFLSLLNFPA